MLRTKIVFDKGKIKLGEDKLSEMFKTFDGEYLISFSKVDPKTTKEWSNYYFLLRDILYEDGETGYTKKELHELIKANSLLLTTGKQSTKELTEEEWFVFIKHFKEWAFENFNCYL